MLYDPVDGAGEHFVTLNWRAVLSHAVMSTIARRREQYGCNVGACDSLKQSAHAYNTRSTIMPIAHCFCSLRHEAAKSQKHGRIGMSQSSHEQCNHRQSFRSFRFNCQI